MKKILALIFILMTNVSFGQIPKGSIQDIYFNYRTENLSHLERIETYPLFRTEELYSIKNCFRNLSYPEINEIIYKRIVELAQVNFKNNVLLFLVEGKGSVELAEKHNENTKDNNGLIYISVFDFLHLDVMTKGVELYNTETKKLMLDKDISLSFIKKENSKHTKIDSCLVGIWSGSEKDIQKKGLQKSWIIYLLADGMYRIDFTNKFDDGTDAIFGPNATEFGRWWVKNGLFYQRESTSKKPDIYTYKMIDNDRVIFKAKRLTTDFDNKNYSFMNSRLAKDSIK